jgi:hypothetical protein
MQKSICLTYIFSRPISRTTLRRLFFSVAGIFIFQNALAQIPLYESFNYTAGLQLSGQGAWATSKSTITIASGNLNGTGTGLSASSGNMVAVSGGTGGVNGGTKEDFNGGTDVSGNIYFSFLLKLNDTTGIDTSGAGTAIVNLNHGGSGTKTAIAILLYNNAGHVEAGIAKYAGSSTAVASGFATAGAGSAIEDGNVYLIVGEYRANSGNANDTVSLWVNPASLGGADDSSPQVNVIGSGTTDSASGIGRIYVNPGFDADIDELRISTNWADVTPPSVCHPAGISSGATPSTQTVNVGAIASFSVSATGNAPTYQWQVSTDGGSSFNNVATGSGANSANYSTAALATTDNNNQYRCVASVSCDGSSVTSSVAAITVINSSIYSFRTIQSGNWNDTNTWQQSTNGVNWVPAFFTPFATTSNVTVRAGHTIAVTASVSVDRLVIQAGGEVDASGATLTIANTGAVPVDCDVLGTLQAANVAASAITSAGANVTFENGGVFIWNSPAAGIIPPATWADGSACEILSGVSGIAPTGLNQSFYDFIWNWPGSGLCNLDGQLTTVRNDLTMTGTSSSAASVRFLQSGFTCNLNVGGNFTVAGGVVSLSGGAAANTVLNIFVGKNFTIAGGATLNSRQGKLNTGANSSANIIFTNTAAAQSLTDNGSILHDGDGVGCPINWQVASGVTVNLSGNLPLGPANFSSSDSVIVDGTLNLNGNQITGSSLGTLTIDSSGTIAGSGTSQLATTLGTINYGGTLNLPGLPALNSGDNFKLFDAAAYNGAFNSIVPSTPAPTLFWDTSQLTASGTLFVTASGTSIPRITSTILSGSNLILSGNNGSPNVNYNVLTSTNLNLPPASWPVAGTGAFDSGGNFSFTNSIDTTIRSAFFLIQVP